MPRIRTIKPDFFKSEDVSALPLRARLTWIGLWTHCDDHGRTKDNPRLIKGELWSLDDVSLRDIEEDLAVLAAHGRIVRYQVEQKPYLAVVNWHAHQTINRPSKAKHPGPPVPVAAGDPDEAGHCTQCSIPNPHAQLREPSLSPHDTTASLTEASVRPPGASTHPEYLIDRTTHAGQGHESTPGARFHEGSVSPPGRLTQPSHQERKGREGKGGERAPAREPGRSPSSPDPPEPSDRCPRHLDEPSGEPCGPCADARRIHQRWEHQRAQAASLRQQAKARAVAEGNRAAIDHCQLCDDAGFVDGRLCAHDPGLSERALRGAALAAAAIRRPGPTHTNGSGDPLEAIDAILASQRPPQHEEEQPT